MSRNTLKISGIKFASIVLFFLGGFGLLGSLELSTLGIKIDTLFIKFLGIKAWIASFILLILSSVGWLSTSQPFIRLSLHSEEKSPKRKYRNMDKAIKYQSEQSNQTNYTDVSNVGKPGIHLPPGKLINLHGFNQYFLSQDLEIGTSATREDLSEIGSNFYSYFKEGEKVHNHSKRVAPLNGFREYFGSNNQQSKTNENDFIQNTNIKNENEVKVSKDNLPPSVSVPIKIDSHLEMNDQKFEHLKQKEEVSKGQIESQFQNTDLSINDSNCSTDNKEISEDTYYPGQVAQLVQKGKYAHGDSIWSLPQVDLLDPVSNELSFDEQTGKSEILEEVLNNFGIKGRVVKVTHGPVITRYELVPAPGVKISRIVNLADDIALTLAAKDVRIEAPIPGKSAIGIEVPKRESKMVSFREVMESGEYEEHNSLLKIALGKDIAGSPIVADLGKMPHLLVAGATGSGKSVCINTIINSILYNATPQEVKLLLIDPKMVELSSFNGIPHLIAPVVTDSRAASSFLKWAVKEMESRYELFAARGVRDIKSFNNLFTKSKTFQEKEDSLPLIVIIIDELADLMMVSAKDVEEAICRLAQMARAAGIHLIIATQRPSVDVITGVIKANIPSRIAFAVTSQIDSRTILDSTGAEKLLGKGDMLFSPIGLNKPIRIQGCFINDEEAKHVCEHWKSQGKPDYLSPETILTLKNTDAETIIPGDELLVEAAELVISSGVASVSYLQRKFKIGYSRAARLIDLLEEEGVVGGYEGPKPRQVLMDMEQFYQKHS